MSLARPIFWLFLVLLCGAGDRPSWSDGDSELACVHCAIDAACTSDGGVGDDQLDLDLDDDFILTSTGTLLHQEISDAPPGAATVATDDPHPNSLFRPPRLAQI